MQTCGFLTLQTLKHHVERRRRQRINCSLDKLKSLLVLPQVKDTRLLCSARHPITELLSAGAKKLFVTVVSSAGRGSAQSGESGDPGAHCSLSTETQRQQQRWSCCCCCWSPQRLLPRRLLRLPGESCSLPGPRGKRPAPQGGAAAVRLCWRLQPGLGFCRLQERT